MLAATCLIMEDIWRYLEQAAATNSSHKLHN